MATAAVQSAELDFINDASAALILDLQTQDTQELLSGAKGKGREGNMSDTDYALTIFQEDLHIMDRIIADRSISRSMMRAVMKDDQHPSSTDRR